MIPTTRPRARRVFTLLKTGLAALIAFVLLYGLAASFPKPLFKYRAVYQNYHVWSDRPIPAEITDVLDDTTRRWRTSILYNRDTPVELFFCNEPWRLWLYGRSFSTKLGGAADVWFTRQVFIRASNIAENRIHSPGRGQIADAAQRPLSYFIAHEIAHSDVSRKFGRTIMLRYPRWLLDGYSDYVGKGGDFDFEANRALYLAGAPELDYRRSGLYRGFHLKVAYLLDKKGWTLEQVFERTPGEDQLDAWLRATR